MWLVDKLHNGTEDQRELVPDDLLRPMIRWYIGQGSENDEKIGVALVQRAKLFERWMACDCLGSGQRPPLLSPAYLAEAETFYLRRLTGEGRPEHRTECPFYRDQAAYGGEQREREAPPLKPVDGFFAALKPLGEHLAQQPVDDATDNRDRRASTPRLARLLWQPMGRAETNIIDPVMDRSTPSIPYEYDRLRAASRDLWIAPGKALCSHLFSHPEDLRRNRIYARLREAAKAWPADHEPQAFLLLYAPTVSRREVFPPDGEPIRVATDIAKPPAKLVDRGPYLVLLAIGEHAQARGYAPVRAYAQPIQDGRHFYPVDSEAQRKLLQLLLSLQWPLHEAGIATRIKKPVFDLDTEFGPCQPSFMVEIVNHRRRTQGMLNIHLKEAAPDGTRQSAEIRVPRMRLIAPVIEVEPAELANKPALGQHLYRWIVAA